MLTAVQVRLLAACPTCAAPVGKQCRDRKRQNQMAKTANHRLRVRAAEARATALRLSGQRYHPI